MPAYDSGFKIAARASGRELAEAAGLFCSHWRPIASEVQVTERFADRAFRATCNGERCVVYFEAYTYWQKHALWNVLSKAGMLSEREKLPTLSILYILRPRGYKTLDGQFRLKVGTQPTQQLWYFPVPLWQQKPADWWEACPGLMTMYPLTQHDDQPQEAVRYAAEAIRTIVAEAGLQADLLSSLAFFSQLAYPGLNLFEFIGRQEMKHPKFLRELIAEEAEEVRSVERRSAITEALQARFGEEAGTIVTPQIATITDKALLSRLLRLAVTCRSLQEFQAALSGI